MSDPALAADQQALTPTPTIGGLNRLRWYIRSTFPLLVAVTQLFNLAAATTVTSLGGAPLIILMIGTVAMAVVQGWLSVRLSRQIPTGHWWGPPRGDRIATAVLTIAVAVGWGVLITDTSRVTVIGLALVGYVCAVVPLMRWTTSLLALLVALGVTAGLVAGTGLITQVVQPERVVPVTDFVAGETAGRWVSLVVGGLMLVLTCWVTAWMLRVVEELDVARRRSAQLAIAEERLRIARDLHDVFGRTLAVVAVKSELAAGLARRGRTDQAVEEMQQIRSIASDAGQQVRGVVRGAHAVGLTQELAGARSLLDSAGIDCRIETPTDPDRLDERTAVVLGWVVREAVTNILRHSHATRCDIVFGPDATAGAGAGVRLMIVNDGAGGPTAGASGSGLLGMADRLAAIGGTLAHQRVGEKFELTVRVEVQP